MKVYSILFNLLVTFLLIINDSNGEHKESDVCSRSCRSSMNDSYVAEFCQEHHLHLQRKGRCCFNLTESQVVGVDLRDCDLSELKDLFVNLASLLVILLQDNSIANVTSSEFQGLLNLEYLALPRSASCPGGSEAWEVVNTTANETLCLQEVDFCLALNVSCPMNSMCTNTGPGINECLCLPGYHGYKCLRQGTFPTIAFSAGMVGAMLVVSGFLWVTQRRNVKKTV